MELKRLNWVGGKVQLGGSGKTLGHPSLNQAHHFLNLMIFI